VLANLLVSSECKRFSSSPTAALKSLAPLLDHSRPCLHESSRRTRSTTIKRSGPLTSTKTMPFARSLSASAQKQKLIFATFPILELPCLAVLVAELAD